MPRRNLLPLAVEDTREQLGVAPPRLSGGIIEPLPDSTEKRYVQLRTFDEQNDAFASARSFRTSPCDRMRAPVPSRRRTRSRASGSTEERSTFCVPRHWPLVTTNLFV